MEIIRSLVQNLIVIVILAMFLEMLLPVGEMKKYVKMVMGLLIIIAVVQAVGDLARWDYTTDLPSLVEKEKGEHFPAILESGQKITGEQQEVALEQYRHGLARQVMALAGVQKETSVIDVEVTVQPYGSDPGFGKLKEIILYIPVEPDIADATDKQEVLAGGIKPVTVQVGHHGKPAQAGSGSRLPGKDVTGLINLVANFYNLNPEQVKVVCR